MKQISYNARKMGFILAVAVAASYSGAAQAQVQQRQGCHHWFTCTKHYLDDHKLTFNRSGVTSERDYVPRSQQAQPGQRKGFGTYFRNALGHHDLGFGRGGVTITPRH